VTPRQTAELIFLAALWGASFLLLRIAVPEFGPVALIGLRVGIAAAFLVVVLAGRGELPRRSGLRGSRSAWRGWPC
jgi:drug/metabolite transporter (DMT)-like permease